MEGGLAWAPPGRHAAVEQQSSSRRITQGHNTIGRRPARATQTRMGATGKGETRVAYIAEHAALAALAVLVYRQQRSDRYRDRAYRERAYRETTRHGPQIQVRIQRTVHV